jgi:dGTPase
VAQQMPQIGARRAVHETVRRIIDTLVSDLIDESGRRIATAAPASIEDVRAAAPLVAFSADVRAQADVLKGFLHRNLYRHTEVLRMTTKAARIVRELFAAFQAEPRLLPAEHCARAEQEGPRAIADYIAGMTDRFAIREHRRLFAVGEF